VDIFKFNTVTNSMLLERGEIVNGLKSKLWIERYDKAGEFTFVANASTGIRDILPIGTMISHLESYEVMIVENHEITDKSDEEAEIVITGRGFESYFENRIVGSNKAFPTNTGVQDYTLVSATTWEQTVTMLRDHIYASALLDDNDSLPYIQILHDVSGSGVATARSMKKGDLYSAMQELLAIDSLGIKVIRPGPWSPLVSGGSTDIAAIIHKGVDRSNSIIFSYDTGEIESADYLWSNKKLKNTAVIIGRWVETIVTTGFANFARRVMLVEASDMDNSYSVAPTGTDLANVIAAMQQRGYAALAAQNEVSLTKAEVSKDNTKALYRTDFDVGDIIMVNGDYNESSTMRISEYVEVEDENGRSGYPTLTMV
jgi:hypothetical protein